MSGFGGLSFLNHDDSLNPGGSSTGRDDALFGSSIADNRTDVEKQAEVVKYLTKLTSSQKASSVDIQKELGIFLNGKDARVLRMLKSNMKVEVIMPGPEGGEVFYRYHTDFEVRDCHELLALINRRDSGIQESDVSHCYNGVQQDLEAMILAGEVIAWKNKEGGDRSIFRRGTPFYVELSGAVTATHNTDSLRTERDLQKEIRRGDAISLEFDDGAVPKWFRVDCAIDSRPNQPERGRPPLTVSSLVPRALKQNSFAKPFNRHMLPLDSDFKSNRKTKKTEPHTGVAVKHGCTNDIRDMWIETREDIKDFIDQSNRSVSRSDMLLTQRLIQTGLISQQGLALSNTSESGQKRIKRVAKKKPAQKRRIGQKVSNAHLEGTLIGDLARQHREGGGGGPR